MGNLDAVTLIRDCSLVCRRWNSIIFSAQWKVLQKYRYKEVIVSETGSFHVKFEKLTNHYKRLQNIKRKSRLSFDKAAKRMRRISCEKLTFEDLAGENFLRVLKDYTSLCMDTKFICFKFCNFMDIEGNVLISFFKERKRILNEVCLDMCRNVNNCLSPGEFTDAISEIPIRKMLEILHRWRRF